MAGWARVHNRVARTVVDWSDMCPVCGLFFHTRQRVIHHIDHSCESCKAAVKAGLVQTLPEARRSAERQGDKGSLIWLCVVRNEVAGAYCCLPVHTVCCGGAPFSSDAPLCAFLVIACGLFRAGSSAFVCLFCCDPKHGCVDPVSVRALWPCCICPSVRLVRALHSVLVPCLRERYGVAVTTHPRISVWHRRCW